jgi:hypothetical protein
MKAKKEKEKKPGKRQPLGHAMRKPRADSSSRLFRNKEKKTKTEI